jgi:hypothetical protein
MNANATLLICAVLFTVQQTFAQDKIYKTNGDIIEVKVKTVNTKEIIYKRFDNLEGPDYKIGVKALSKIEYDNGVEEFYNESNETTQRVVRKKYAHNSAINYGKNVIAFSPAQLTNDGFGFGLSYERMLDKENKISFYLPVSYTYTNLRSDNTYYNSNYNNVGFTDKANMFYAYPGLKIYPKGLGIVRYAVGPSLAIGAGSKLSSRNYDPNTNTYYYTTENHFLLGFMVNNSININPTPKLFLGLELGLGVSYLDQVDGANKGVGFLTQFAFKVGFRF